MEQMLLEIILNHMENKEVVDDSLVFSLEKTRLHGDLIVAFQYLKGLKESWRGTFYKSL